MSEISGASLYKWKIFDDYCKRVVKNMVVAKLIETKGSITAAAAELGHKGGGAALSQRLDGVVGFIGGEVNEGSRLTPIGTAMAQLWDDSRPCLEQFIEKIEALKDERLLRVVTIESTWRAEEEWLRKEYLNIVSGGLIEARYAHSLNTVVHAVREGLADIGIASFPSKSLALPPGIKMKVWRNEDLVFVMPYWKARGWSETKTTIRASDMPRHSLSFLAPPKKMVMYKEVIDYLRRNGAKFEFIKPCGGFDEVINRVAMMRDKDMDGKEQDGGVSILPEPVVRRELFKERIDYVKCNPAFQRPIVVIYREKSLKPNLQRAFLEVIEKHKKDPRPHDEAYFDSLPTHFAGRRTVVPKFVSKPNDPGRAQ